MRQSVIPLIIIAAIAAITSEQTVASANAAAPQSQADSNEPGPDTTTCIPDWIERVSKYVNFDVNQLGAFGWTDQELRDSDLAVASDGSIYLLCNIYQKHRERIYRNILLVKYNKNHEREWYKQIGSDRANDNGAAVAIDAGGNVYVAGALSDTYESRGIKHAYTRAFVESYTSAGKRRWSFLEKAPRDKSSSAYYDIALSGNSIYLTGRLDREPSRGRSFQGHRNDLLVTRLRLNGEKVWSKQYEAASDREGLTGYGIACHENDQICIVGRRVEEMLQPFIEGHSGMDRDAFVIKIDDAGRKKWSRIIGIRPGTSGFESQWEHGTHEGAVGVTVDSEANIYVAGNSDAPICTFETDPKRFHNMPFLAKFTEDGNQQWIRQYSWKWSGVEAKNMTLSQDNHIFIVGRARGFNSFFVIEYDTKGSAVKQIYAEKGVLDRNNKNYYPFRGDSIAISNLGNASQTMIVGEGVDHLNGPIREKNNAYHILMLSD